MAEGSGDHPLDPHKGRSSQRTSLSPDDIRDQASHLLTIFIHDRMENDRRTGNTSLSVVPSQNELLPSDTPSGPPVAHLREVALALRTIGDTLDRDTQLQRLINQITPDAPHQTFLKVAQEIFQDGVFNWGRVVALFYFAYKMAVKALVGSISALPLVRRIIEWVANFIFQYIAGWIIERGGWESIQEYFGTTTGQMVMIAALCVLSAVFVLVKNRLR